MALTAAPPMSVAMEPVDVQKKRGMGFLLWVWFSVCVCVFLRILVQYVFFLKIMVQCCFCF